MYRPRSMRAMRCVSPPLPGWIRLLTNQLTSALSKAPMRQHTTQKAALPITYSVYPPPSLSDELSNYLSRHASEQSKHCEPNQPWQRSWFNNRILAQQVLCTFPGNVNNNEHHPLPLWGFSVSREEKRSLLWYARQKVK